MGGRGAAAGGSISLDNRHWEQIPKSLTGVNEIDGVKIIRDKRVSNARTPIESNTPNATYIIADSDGKISYITKHKDNHISMSVDILKDGASHMHYWDDGGRERHKKSNEHATPSSLKELAEKCAEYNKRITRKKK